MQMKTPRKNFIPIWEQFHDKIIGLEFHESDQWKQKFKKNGGSSDLAVDLEKTKEPWRPADLRRKCYKVRGHGGGLSAAFLDTRTLQHTYIHNTYHIQADDAVSSLLWRAEPAHPAKGMPKQLASRGMPKQTKLNKNVHRDLHTYN